MSRKQFYFLSMGVSFALLLAATWTLTVIPRAQADCFVLVSTTCNTSGVPCEELCEQDCSIWDGVYQNQYYSACATTNGTGKTDCLPQNYLCGEFWECREQWVYHPVDQVWRLVPCQDEQNPQPDQFKCIFNDTTHQYHESVPGKKLGGELCTGA